MNMIVRTTEMLIAAIALSLGPAVLVQGADAAGAVVCEVDSIVRRAMEAEVDGRAELRQTLLAGALAQDPKHAAARWQSGYVQIGDQWLTVEELERHFKDSDLVSAYRRFRDQYSGRLAGEIWLARWCRKHGLEERERLHWNQTLRLDSSNAEARGRLRLREFRGRLLTPDQIMDWKRGMQEYQQALDQWDPKLARLRREIESSTLKTSTDAWRDFAGLDDPSAVPSLEKLFYRAEPEIQQEIVSILGNIDDQVATDALVRLALNTDRYEMLCAAAIRLGDRSWFGFVPSLLVRLETPIEYHYAIEKFGDVVISDLRFSKENPFAVVNQSQSSRVGVPVYIRPDRREPRTISFTRKRQQERLQQEAGKMHRQIASSIHAIHRSNAHTNALNQKIYRVLETSTGERLDSNPRSWWDWWKQYNELENSEEKPYFNLYRQSSYDRPIIINRAHSCFAAGTPVWTEAGELPIERVRVGDRVLSQDPLSGELRYHLVTGTTIRPPSETVRITVADEQIVATLGHPMWVAGQGWRMAKQLKVGDQLHGVKGGVAIDQIEPGPIVEAYNLVVDQANTYFVSRHRVLVHDNLIRRPFEQPLPGWLAVNN
jgi:hypothetical protein